MSEFEESLKKSIYGVGEAYRTAEKDLYEEVAAASESVKRVTGGIASLALRKTKETSAGTEFELYVQHERSAQEVAVLYVDANGYPIKVAASDLYLVTGDYEDIFARREDIRKYLNNAASTPDSRLVLRIAYLLRIKSAEAGKNSE